jgi:hypothetical protein
MHQLTFILEGDEALASCEALRRVVTELDPMGTPGVRRSTPRVLQRKAIVDPIALGTLILSVPPAVLAVVDLADRAQKRRHAERLIEAASNGRCSSWFTPPTGPGRSMT